MRSSTAFFLIVFLAGGSAARAAENVMLPAAAPVPVARFVSLEAFDFAALVPPPPTPGSLAAEADLLAVRQAQAWRTEEQIAWAKRVERDQVFAHAEIVGGWFAEEKLPRTAAFFKALGEDLRAVDRAAKLPFQRPRPSTVDPALQPCVTVPASTSYPSGSATQAFVWAELLGEIFPAHREAIGARAQRVAWGRLLGGVHFPSDLVAGQRLAPAYLAEARKNAEFRAALEACQRELAAAAKAAAAR